MAKRNIEVFIGGCPLCEEAVQVVKDVACESCDVAVHDLAKSCETDECVTRARDLGIRSVPTVVVDGQIAACCRTPGVSADELRRLGVGSAA